MKKNFWDKRIPTLLGIFLITIGVGVTTLLVKQGTLFQTKASPSEQPQNVRITNVTDNTFTVSYTTDALVIGSINYGKTQELGQSGLDDRDQESGSLTSFSMHNITVRNLSPGTRYLFTITSGKDTYMNNSHPFEVTTGNTISVNPTSQEPMSGKIILPDGSTPKEALLYVTADNSQVISVLTKSDGTYILPLNAVRTADFSAYYDFSQNQSIKILAIGNSLTSNAKLTIDQIHPVPTITLSSDYDFTLNQAPVASNSGVIQSFPSFGSNSSPSNPTDNSPAITTPEKNQGFTDQQPLFKGKAVPAETVEVTIHSDSTKTTVTADKNGNWSYRPATALPPGNHTITITTKNSDGILKTITQSFVVFAAGTQVSQSATPSATTTPTPAPTKKPTATPTLTPTQTPTPAVIAQISETETPTPIVTETPTPTDTLVSITPTPTKKLLPATGNASIMTAGILGIVISVIGALLFLMTRGGISAL